MAGIDEFIVSFWIQLACSANNGAEASCFLEHSANELLSHSSVSSSARFISASYSSKVATLAR